MTVTDAMMQKSDSLTSLREQKQQQNSVHGKSHNLGKIMNDIESMESEPDFKPNTFSYFIVQNDIVEMLNYEMFMRYLSVG